MSNPTLDHAAEIVAAARGREDLAALAPVEQAVIDKALAAAPELDRRTIGAAWMMLGNAIAQLANGTQLDVAQAVNIAQLAGQRLYSGVGLPREVGCPWVYDSGAACKFVAKGATDAVADASMRGHYATYHPAGTWPPEPEPVAVSDSSQPGWYSGVDQFSRCACGAPAALAVGYRGEPGPVPQCTACATADPRHYFGHRDIEDPTAPIICDRLAPDARYLARCSKCTVPVVMNGLTGQNAGHLTVEGILCGSCNAKYKRALGKPVDEALDPAPERVVHLPRLDANGNPTDYALCDNGERSVAPGTLSYGGPGFGKADPTCQTCLEIDENGGPDPDQPPLPHDVYMDAVSAAIEELGAPYDDHEYFTTTPDGETLDGVFTFQDDDVNPGQWPDGVALQWSQKTGWQLCTKGENRTLFDLTVEAYANPRAVAVEARARLRHGMDKPLRDIGERSWDGAAATEAAVRAWEADGGH